jgi:hypothetical protein
VTAGSGDPLYGITRSLLDIQDLACTERATVALVTFVETFDTSGDHETDGGRGLLNCMDWALGPPGGWVH